MRPLPPELLSVCEPLPGGSRHALHVAGLANRLFVACAYWHGLAKPAAPLVQTAALLCRAMDKRPSGTPWLPFVPATLKRVAPELSHAERALIERALVIFNNDFDNQTDANDDALGELNPDLEIARRVAAIVGLAYALDSRETQDTQVVGVEDSERGLVLLVQGGGEAHRHAGAALQMSAAWNRRALLPICGVVISPMEDSEAYPGLERGSVGELALRHFRRQMGQYHSRVHGLARPDEVEYTHEMRVALRRLRAVKRLFGGALDGIPDDFDEDLKKWGRALGRVRDADVFMDYLRECEKDKGVQPDFLRKITRHLRDERRELRRHLLEELSSASEWRFDLLYWRLACAPQGDSDALRIGSKGRKPAVEKAPAILRKRLKSLRKFNKPLELCAPEELHALRVASKWARYAAEFLRDCYPDRLRALRMIMRRLQDRLGRVHDCDVFQRRAREYADRGLGGEEDAAGLQSLLDHIARDRQVALEKSIRAWKRYQKKRPQIMKSIQ